MRHANRQVRYDKIRDMQISWVKANPTMKTTVVDHLPEYLEQVAAGEHKHDVTVLSRLLRMLAGFL